MCQDAKQNRVILMTDVDGFFVLFLLGYASVFFGFFIMIQLV